MQCSDVIDAYFESKEIVAGKVNIAGFIGYKVNPADLTGILEFVKTSADLRFTILTDLFAADFPSRSKRFEIVYSLLSLKLNTRLLFKVEIAEEEHTPSIYKIFSAACWYEREIFDMFGINFTDSIDHRRILTDYGFVGHPLRKDFPVTGRLQVKYDEKLERVVYEPVELDLEFRMYDFLSPWYGPEKAGKPLLPGDEKASKYTSDK